MNPRSTRRWASWGLLLGAIGLVAWWCWEQSHPPTLRLADGRVGIVRAVSYGTNHVFVDGPLWLRIFGRFLPRATTARGGLLRHRYVSAGPCALVWAEWSYPPTNRAPTLCSVADRHGIHSELRSRVVSATGNERAIQAFLLENYPRWERTVHVHFYDRDAAGSAVRWLGEVSVANTARQRARWGAPLAPITVTNDGLVCTLLSLRCGDDPPASLTGHLIPRLAPPALATFHLAESGGVGGGWALWGLEARGSSGNVFRGPRAMVWEDGKLLLALVGDALWPDEPDWRLRVEWGRTRDFPTLDLVTLRSINAQRTNPPFTTNLQVASNGTLLKSLELRGTRQVRRWVPGGYHPNSDLGLEFTAPEGSRIDLVRITDDHGRDVRFGHLAQPGSTRLEAGVELPYDIRTVDVTVAVHRSVFVEFLVRPDWNTSLWSSASVFSSGRGTFTKGGR